MSRTLILASTLLLGAGVVAWWRLFSGLTSPPSIPPSQPPAATAMGDSTGVTVASRPPSSPWLQLTDSSLSWQVRTDMLRRLDKEQLSAADIETLYQLLNHQPSELNSESWWVTVNEIMEQLRKQAIAPARYTPALLSLLANPDTPEVLRDYAVQHLGQWLTPRGAAQGFPHEEDPARVQEAAQVLAALVTDPTLVHTSVPGTTLTVLADMQVGGLATETLQPLFQGLSPWLHQTLRGQNNSSLITRTSAINALGTLRQDSYRPVIRTLATSPTDDSSVRLSSIAALGRLGSQDDLAVLSDLAAGSTKFRFAAQAAHQQLSAHLASSL